MPSAYSNNLTTTAEVVMKTFVTLIRNRSKSVRYRLLLILVNFLTSHSVVPIFGPGPANCRVQCPVLAGSLYPAPGPDPVHS
jgi:hypothetical protein